jgi:hypothetical protein
MISPQARNLILYGFRKKKLVDSKLAQNAGSTPHPPLDSTSRYCHLAVVSTLKRSVLVAEAAALALAAIITDRLSLQQVDFLSNSQQLVHFLDGQDQTNPSERRIKYYTQIFSNFTS